MALAYVIDETGRMAPINTMVPPPKAGYRAIPSGKDQSGKPIFKYVPEKGTTPFDPAALGGVPQYASKPRSETAEFNLGVNDPELRTSQYQKKPSVTVAPKKAVAPKKPVATKPATQTVKDRLAQNIKKKAVAGPTKQISKGVTPRAVTRELPLPVEPEELSSLTPEDTMDPGLVDRLTKGLDKQGLDRYKPGRESDIGEDVLPLQKFEESAAARTATPSESGMADVKAPQTAYTNPVQYGVWDKYKQPDETSELQAGVLEEGSKQEDSGALGKYKMTPEGEDIPWTKVKGATSSTQMPVIEDKESLQKLKDLSKDNEIAKSQLAKYLTDIEDIGKGDTGVVDRKKLALEEYGKSLDAADKAKMWEVIIKGAGKALAGATGLKTGTPVGMYYKDEPSGIPEMRKDTALKKFQAEEKAISEADKEKKGSEALKLQARQNAIDMALKLPAEQQKMLYQILQLQNGMKTLGTTDTTNFITAENLQKQLTDMDFEESQKYLQHQLDLKKAEYANAYKTQEREDTQAHEATQSELNRRSNELRSAMGTMGGKEGGAGGVTYTQSSDQAQNIDQALFYGSEFSQNFLNPRWKSEIAKANDALAKGDKQTHDQIVNKVLDAHLAHLQEAKRRAYGDKNQIAKQHFSYVGLVNQSRPYFTSARQLEDIPGNIAKLTMPGAPLQHMRGLYKLTGAAAPQIGAKPTIPEPPAPIPRGTPKQEVPSEAKSSTIFMLEKALQKETDPAKRAKLEAALERLRKQK